MEEMHRSHKEPAWGWMGALAEWRRSRTRRRVRQGARPASRRGL